MGLCSLCGQTTVYLLLRLFSVEWDACIGGMPSKDLPPKQWNSFGIVAVSPALAVVKNIKKINERDKAVYLLRGRCKRHGLKVITLRQRIRHVNFISVHTVTSSHEGTTRVSFISSQFLWTKRSCTWSLWDTCLHSSRGLLGRHSVECYGRRPVLLPSSGWNILTYRSTTRRHNTEDSDLNFHRRENLKSRIEMWLMTVVWTII